MCKVVSVSVILMLVLSIAPITLHAESSWVLSSEEMGINVYYKTRDSSPFNLVRAQMDIDVGLDQLAKIMRDIPNYNKWMFGCVRSDVLARTSEFDFTLYYVHETPWPFNYRDVVLSIKATDGLQEGWFTVEMEAVDNTYTLDEDYVRMAEMIGKWRFESIGEKVSRVTFILVVDPAGDVPTMFVNTGKEKVVFESFLGLKGQALGAGFEKDMERYRSEKIEEYDSI